MPVQTLAEKNEAATKRRAAREKHASDLLEVAETGGLLSWKTQRAKLLAETGNSKPRDRAGDLAFLAMVATTGGRNEDALVLYGAMTDLSHGQYRPMTESEQNMFIQNVGDYCSPQRKAMNVIGDLVYQYGLCASMVKALPETDSQYENARERAEQRGANIEIKDINGRWEKAKGYLHSLKTSVQGFLAKVTDVVAVERAKSMEFFTDNAASSDSEDEDDEDMSGRAVEQTRQSVLYVSWGRMQGDVARYQLEMIPGDSVLIDRALTAYEGTRKYSLKRLVATHPARVAIAMNTAIYFAEVLGSLRKAIGVANVALADALEGLSRGDTAIGADDMGKVVLMLQELQQLLRGWKKQRSATDAYDEEHRLLFTSANKGVQIQKEGQQVIFFRAAGIACISSKAKPDSALKDGVTSITLQLAKCGPKGVCVGICNGSYNKSAVAVTKDPDASQSGEEPRDLHPTNRGAWCMCSDGSLIVDGKKTVDHHPNWHRQGVAITLTYRTTGTMAELEWQVGDEKMPTVPVPTPAQGSAFLCVCGGEKTEWRMQ
jgi:hypothetical protein